MKKRWDKVDATVRTLCYLHDSRKRQAGLANFLIFAMESFKNQFCASFQTTIINEKVYQKVNQLSNLLACNTF